MRDILERKNTLVHDQQSSLSHPCCRCCSFPPSFFFLLCFQLPLHAAGREVIRLFAFWMRWAEPAAHQSASTVYGSGGLQGRSSRSHVAPRTGSHAFPRDLRGSHPRDHGGDGEKVQVGVSSGQNHADQRQRDGEARILNSIGRKHTDSLFLKGLTAGIYSTILIQNLFPKDNNGAILISNHDK